MNQLVERAGFFVVLALVALFIGVMLNGSLFWTGLIGIGLAGLGFLIFLRSS